MVAGAVLIAVSIVGGGIAFGLLAGRIDLAELERDVVVDGDATPTIPGEVRFDVDRPLSGGGDEAMTVGIAVGDGAGATPRCTVSAADGGEVAQMQTPLGSSLLHGDTSFTVLSEVELRPGAYVAACRWTGEPSTSRPTTRFTVGRTLGNGDLSTFLGPVIGMLAVIGVAGVMFVVGVILLIVGLVRQSRGRPRPAGRSIEWPSPPPDQDAPRPPMPGPPASGSPVPPAPPTSAPGRRSEWTVPERYSPDPPPAPPTPPPVGPPPAPPTVPPDALPHWPTPPGQS